MVNGAKITGTFWVMIIIICIEAASCYFYVTVHQTNLVVVMDNGKGVVIFRKWEAYTENHIG